LLCKVCTGAISYAAVQYEAATIVSNTELGPGHHEVVLQFDSPLADLQAGQFLTLRCDPADRHSLLRPFSILDSSSAGRTLSVYYKELGRLSSRLAQLPHGTQLDCVYPLGHGFPWRDDWRHVALVGGGVGIAPLLCMARQLEPYGRTMSVTGYFGGNSAPDLVPPLLERYQFPMRLATMDGTAGYHGTVVELFAKLYDYYDAVYTCGPNRMLAALQQVLPGSCVAFASLEEYMACGVGACYGCAAKIQVDGAPKNLRVCHDGPVFDLRAVVFEQ
jgi:dihydroorotate dehydrogenase electron transfer subunit